MDNDGTDPVALFLRSILAVGRRVRAERPPGALSLSGLGILGSLNRNGPLAATKLAVEERLQPQSLTRLISDLQKLQLISRKRSELDRRELIIAITARGQKALFEDIAARRTWLEMAMSAALTPREREVMLSVSAIMLKLAAYQPTSA
jgi:DNA-binding MarR family transcriptional regulator